MKKENPMGYSLHDWELLSRITESVEKMEKRIKSLDKRIENVESLLKENNKLLEKIAESLHSNSSN